MENHFKVISFDEIKKYRNLGNCEVIDLRSRQDYMKEHVEGARNMPSFSQGDLRKMSRQKSYILYCDRGSLSFKIARMMAKNGFDVMTVAGGYRSEKEKR